MTGLVAGEHGPVDRDPQQESDKVMGGEKRILNAQQSALGQQPKLRGEGRESVFEALLVPGTAERLTIAGTWNSMVTHRVMITSAAQIDRELVVWLREAYAKA